MRDLVLIGGGHAHVQVLRKLGMQPMPGVRVTVIAREPHTPYSGMLPGHVAGAYSADEMHIDLGPLCRFAGARLLCEEVTAMDLEARVLTLAARPALRFDTLSLNTGASPGALSATDAASELVRVKPIGRFLPAWQRCLEALSPDDRILLIGAGAGAVELAFAMRQAVPATVGLALVGRTLLPGFPERARGEVRLQLGRQKIALLEGDPVASWDAAGAQTEAGECLQAEHYFDVTGVQAPGWLAATGLLLDDEGFVRVDEHLRSLSHSFVFAAGDVAHLEGQPRPKSGVYAVRAGPVLYENLRRSWTRLPLKRYRAQRQALAILRTGPGQALAVRGPLTAKGGWVWRLKDAIDRRFMARFQALPRMPEPLPPPELDVALQNELPDPMRCGGCGGKVPAVTLGRVLNGLPPQAHPSLIAGVGDDAARLQFGPTAPEVLATVDGFSAFIDDPYRFGRIACQHALGDVLAMGGEPTAALALATLPPMGPALLERDLSAMLAGVTEVLAEHGAVLAGGHSAEGAETALGLTILGAPGPRLLAKAGMQPGARLVLTRGLGTGVILAAAMRDAVPTRIVQAALAEMDQSSRAALEVLLAHDVQAATDITGFGLLGHLAEMAADETLGLALDRGRFPALTGAQALLEGTVRSSLHAANRAVLTQFADAAGVPLGAASDWRLDLACDPQTAGGLLAAVPEERAAECIDALQAAGCSQAVEIGAVTAGGGWTIA